MKSSFYRAVGAALLLAVSFGSQAASLPNFGKLEERLKIRPEQKEQYDTTIASTQRALVSVALVAMQLKDNLAREFAKPRPDFKALAREHEALIEQTRPLFKEAGEEWKKLYAQLDDEQVEIAKSFLRENLGRLLQ